ncbi:MAG: hypothetical protein WCN92_06410 [Eubacteriales bacterium]
MAFETISFEDLRQSVSKWELCCKRGNPLPTDFNAEDFVESFKIPETEFEFTQSYVDQSGDVIVLFKTTIHLHAWQTRGGKEPKDFSYYKITRAILDEEGKILDYEIKGYVVTSI